jgi:hypothetical protein
MQAMLHQILVQQQAQQQLIAQQQAQFQQLMQQMVFLGAQAAHSADPQLVPPLPPETRGSPAPPDVDTQDRPAKRSDRRSTPLKSGPGSLEPKQLDWTEAESKPPSTNNQDE